MDNQPYGNDQYQPFVVHASRVKIFLLLAGSTVFMLLGIWLIGVSLEVNPDLGVLLRTLGIVFAVLFAIAVLVYVFMLLRPSPLLVVDAQGIDDRSSVISGGRIMWEDISDIRFIRSSGQKTICLHLVDPKAYLARQRGLKRWLMAINRLLVGTPVGIAGQAMWLPLDRVYEEMERRRQHWAEGL